MIVVGTFVGVLVIVLGAYWLVVVRPDAAVRRAMQKRLRPSEETVRKAKLTIAKADRSEPRGVGLIKSLQDLIDQAGRKTKVGQFLFTTFISGFVAGLIVWVGFGVPIAGVVVGLGVMAVPYLLLKRAASKRMWKFEEQFPDAIDLIARALRAGHALPPALAMVGEELSDPVGPEFKLLYDRQNFGMALPDALRSFATRVPVLDAKFFVTAVLTQRETGGNLSGVLDNLSAVIRERFKVKRQVSVISAHGRITAAILSGLPPVLAVLQFLIAPKNTSLLFSTQLGISMLVGAGVLQLVGMLWIRKIIRIEY